MSIEQLTYEQLVAERSRPQRPRRQGYRTILSVPLMREDVAIGAIVLRRTETRLFSERQIALLQTFADQAVIAIENVRLFEKEQQRTRELTEVLEQQTATADLLKVISRSTFDLQTVFTALAESATRLCQADAAFIWRLDGTSFHSAATSEIHEEFNKFAIEHPPALNRSTASGRCVLERRAVHIPDFREDPEYDWGEGQKIGVFRTMLGVPLLRREGAPLGAFVLWRRIVRPFTDKGMIAGRGAEGVFALLNDNRGRPARRQPGGRSPGRWRSFWNTIRSAAVACLSLDFIAMPATYTAGGAPSGHFRRTIDGAPRMPIAAGRNVANGAPVLVHPIASASCLTQCR